MAQVGTNGYFASSNFSGFKPFPFSGGNGLSLIAPFFTDIDISKGSGRIFYQEHSDLSLIVSKAIAEQVDAVINTNKLTNFSSKWLLVASWEEVSLYGNYNMVSVWCCVTKPLYQIISPIREFHSKEFLQLIMRDPLQSSFTNVTMKMQNFPIAQLLDL